MSDIEDRYNALVQATGDIAWTNSAEGEMIGLQPQWCAYTGQSEAEAQGYGWSDAVHPDDARPTLDAWLAAVRARDIFIFEHRVRRRDGNYRWFSIRAVPVLNSNASIREWVGLHRDIDDIKHAQIRGQENNERLQAALDGANAGTFRWNIKTNALDWDENLDRLFGLTGDTTIPSLDGFIACVHPDDRAGVIARCQRCAADGVDFSMEFRVVWPDGTLRWLDDQGKTYFDPDGRPDYMTGMCMDVTDRRQAAERLRRSEEALRLADQRKDEFLATLAHELRNPLAPIRNGVELLRVGLSPDRAERVHRTVQRQLTHMVHLVDDLLDIARISRGKIDLVREPITLDKIFEHAIETSRPLIDTGQHELTVSTPGRPVVVDGDLTRLAQCVSNLLNNAAKYTPASGRIGLAGAVRGGALEITVIDDGIGMAPDLLSKVFDMFAQGTHAGGRAQGGLGIGLSLVRTLVGMHGGTVHAESAGDGRGSAFTIRLPLAATPSMPSPDAEPALPSGIAARHILVVDDNRDGADTLVMLLEAFGHRATMVHDGNAALASVRELRPDIVFLDIGLPDISGYDVARQIRADSALRQPVLIAVTGWGGDRDRRQTREAGFDDHLTKPIAAADVHGIVDRARVD